MKAEDYQVLTSIGSAIAGVRDKVDLLRIMLQHIKPLFGFNDSAIMVLDPQQQFFQDWAVMMPGIDDSLGTEYFYKNINNIYQIKGIAYPGSIIEHKLNQIELRGGPGQLDFQKDHSFSDANSLTILRKLGYVEGIIGRMQVRERLIGAFIINAKQAGCFQLHQYDLFNAVTDLVALAVANIQANEEILQREQEKSLRLELGRVLVDEATWPARLRRASPLLQASVPFQLLIVYIERNPDNYHAYGHYRTGPDEYQTLTTDDLQGIAKLPADQFKAQLRTLTQASTQPLRLTGHELTSYNKKQPLNQLLTGHFRWQASLTFPVTLARFGQVIFFFYSNQPDVYNDGHISALRQVQPTLETVFDKLLAFEEVERLSEQLRQDNEYLREEVQTTYNYEAIIGTSIKLQQVFRQVDQVASTDSTVLIQGETGTGKELIARALHNQSTRKGRVLVKLNCATLPAQLIESELFGHEKGAFTGATEKRLGKFELADGGTIFLDEIGELPLELQAKLLRVLQEREFERLGGKAPIKTNIRIIAATNRDLQQEVVEGRFRSDLYYRLNVFPICLPPLRERPEDITLLAMHYGQKFSQQMNKPFRGIHEESMKELTGYDWPGNVRELENLLEQAVILSNGEALRWGRPLVPSATTPNGTVQTAALITRPSAEPKQDALQRERIFAVFRQTKGKILGKNGAAQLLNMRPALLEVWEREFILSVLADSQGRVRGNGGAAETIGMHPNTLDNRIFKLNISREHVVRQT